MFPEFQQTPETKSFALKIEKRKVTVYFGFGDNSSAFDLADNPELILHFTPKYIGLCDFQGFTNEKNEPLNADTIPAFFDYVKVEPLQE